MSCGPQLTHSCSAAPLTQSSRYSATTRSSAVCGPPARTPFAPDGQADQTTTPTITANPSRAATAPRTARGWRQSGRETGGGTGRGGGEGFVIGVLGPPQGNLSA